MVTVAERACTVGILMPSCPDDDDDDDDDDEEEEEEEEDDDDDDDDDIKWHTCLHKPDANTREPRVSEGLHKYFRISPVSLECLHRIMEARSGYFIYLFFYKNGYANFM